MCKKFSSKWGFLWVGGWSIWVCEEDAEAHRVSSVLLGSEDCILPYLISGRKSFSPLLHPFFSLSSVSVQKVCPCLTWQGKEQLDDPWLVRRHLQDADHTNRDRGQTQGPGSACLDAVLMMLVVALKPCFLLFLCYFNLFFLLSCTVRKEKLWTLPPPALNLHSSVMLIKTCTILLWSNWILNKGWQDYINCKAWRFSEFRV